MSFYLLQNEVRKVGLQERLTFLEKISTQDTSLGDRRLQRWRSQKSLTNNKYYDAKLFQEGLTEKLRSRFKSYHSDLFN